MNSVFGSVPDWTGGTGEPDRWTEFEQKKIFRGEEVARADRAALLDSKTLIWGFYLFAQLTCLPFVLSQFSLRAWLPALASLTLYPASPKPLGPHSHLFIGILARVERQIDRRCRLRRRGFTAMAPATTRIATTATIVKLLLSKTSTSRPPNFSPFSIPRMMLSSPRSPFSSLILFNFLQFLFSILFNATAFSPSFKGFSC